MADTQADATTAYITEQLRGGVAPQAIVSALIAAGWTRGEADAAVASHTRVVPQTLQSAANTFSFPRQPAASPRNNSAAFRHMIVGGLWCGGGIAITAITYALADNNGGGTYVVAWGAIIFGGIQFLRGLFGVMAGN